MENKTVKAEDKKCIECGEKAVAFFPAVDPDIQSYPYCRECLDKQKLLLIIALFETNESK
jgi:hypothetical protein